MQIHIENLTKYFPQSGGANVGILEDINLVVQRGDFIVILGESGSGKSTFLNLLAGLTRPSGGEIRVEGPNRPTSRITGPHHSRSMLFQQPSLLPWLTVAQNIAFGCRLRGDHNELAYRVDQFIEMMGLYGHEQAYPAELSVGQAQRVCLARALIGHPDVLLLDEPFAALDTMTRGRLQEELINIWQSEQFTAVFVTHDIEEAIQLGTRVVLLGGKPATIKEEFPITLPYPRRITDEAFFRVKTKIVNRFKEVVVVPQHPDFLDPTELAEQGYAVVDQT